MYYAMLMGDRKYTWINRKAKLTAFQISSGPWEPTLWFCSFPVGFSLPMVPFTCLLYSCCLITTFNLHLPSVPWCSLLMWVIIRWHPSKLIPDCIFKRFSHTLLLCYYTSVLIIFKSVVEKFWPKKKRCFTSSISFPWYLYAHEFCGKQFFHVL